VRQACQTRHSRMLLAGIQRIFWIPGLRQKSASPGMTTIKISG